MNYVFDATVATIVGVDGAIMMQNISYWIEKNRANNKHLYDGKYWTYNSVNAFEQLFPFWSKKQITRILKNLIDNGYLLDGNYNGKSYDRTKWYTITEKGKSILPNEEIQMTKRGNANDQMGKSILPNGEMEMTKKGNANDQKGKPIPDINTDINTDNTISKDIVSSTKVQQVIDAWNAVGLQKVISIKQGTNRHKLFNARVKQYGLDNILKAIENIASSTFLKGQNKKGWVITFDWFIAPNNFIKVLEGNYNQDNVRKISDYDNSTKNKDAKQKRVFNNFEGRDYDYDDLEKKLLGWDK